MRESKGVGMEGDAGRVKALEGFVVKGAGSRDESKEKEERRLRRGMWLWVAELVPFIVGRAWVLGARPEWF